MKKEFGNMFTPLWSLARLESQLALTTGSLALLIWILPSPEFPHVFSDFFITLSAKITKKTGHSFSNQVTLEILVY